MKVFIYMLCSFGLLSSILFLVMLSSQLGLIKPPKNETTRNEQEPL